MKKQEENKKKERKKWEEGKMVLAWVTLFQLSTKTFTTTLVQNTITAINYRPL
jgi:hypothetical protein